MSKSILFSLLILKALAIFAFLSFYTLPLAPDEAQYWTWSQALDWGYYSKPPGIALQIWLGTQLLGNNELGVRVFSIILCFLLSIIVYFLAKQVFKDEKIAGWSALSFALSPVGIYLAIAATTDIGSILFFTIALCEICRGLKNNEGPNYFKVGLWVGCGALFKWTTYFFWAYLLLALLFQPKLRKREFFWGMGISLLGLIPSLIWNMNHDWATFQHVGKTLYQGSASQNHGNFFDFLAVQIALFSPLFFFFLFRGFLKFVRPLKKENPQQQMLSWIALGALIYLSLASFKKMQPNWAIYLCPSLFILVAAFAMEKFQGKSKWMFIGGTLSIILTSMTLMIPWLQENAIGPQLSYKINPLRQNMGWERLNAILEENQFDAEKNFLIADKYQMASILSFYNAQQIRAHFFNVSGFRKNQFSYFKGLEEEKGKTGYFVIAENKDLTLEHVMGYKKQYETKLADYFKSVQCVGTYPLFENHGKSVKFAMVFRCQDYSGEKPQDPNQY